MVDPAIKTLNIDAILSKTNEPPKIIVFGSPIRLNANIAVINKLNCVK